jgi:hypothetical protein
LPILGVACYERQFPPGRHAHDLDVDPRDGVLQLPAVSAMDFREGREGASAWGRRSWDASVIRTRATVPEAKSDEREAPRIRILTAATDSAASSRG